MMFARGRSKKAAITVLEWHQYTGDTPQDQCAENIRRGMQAFISLLLGHRSEQARDESLRSFADAIDWWAIAGQSETDRMTRWVLAMELGVQANVLDV